MEVEDVIGYLEARKLAKIVAIISAIAISTFSVNIVLLKNIFDFEIYTGFFIRNIVAISTLSLIWFIKNDNLSPPNVLHLKDKGLKKMVYYVLVGFISLGISTFSPSFLTNALNLQFLTYNILNIRNLIAVILLISAKVIHDSG